MANFWYFYQWIAKFEIHGRKFCTKMTIQVQIFHKNDVKIISVEFRPSKFVKNEKVRYENFGLEFCENVHFRTKFKS